MSAKRDTQRQALWDAWLTLGEANKNETLLRIQEIFGQLKQAACVEFKHSAARFARLGTSDEDIYDSLVALMNVYKRVITLGNEINLNSSTVRVLLVGICEVLCSRLREFEEITEQTEDINPVTVEKCRIIDHAAAELGECIIGVEEKFVTRLLAEFRPFTAAVIAEECLHEIYAHFQEGLRLCLAELDDLHLRKIAGLYTDLIKREWEELGNIIKVQVMALESANSQTVDQDSTGELPTVHHILNVLREAYQHVGPVIRELHRLLNSPIARHSGLTFEEFIDTVQPIILPDTEPSAPMDNEFFSLLSHEASAMFEQIQTLYMNAVNQMHHLISDHKVLAEDVVLAFSRIMEVLPKLDVKGNSANAELEPDKKLHLDILKGITETIEIKIESLAESIKSFDEESTSFLHDFSEKCIHPTDEDLQNAQNSIYLTWLNQPPIAIENMAEYFEILPETIDAFKNFKARAQKQMNIFSEKVDKFTFRFKKEVLLYETCTYEEILIHSVSRLRDSDDNEIVNAAKLLDNTYIELEILLKKNDIVAIRPTPHDAFNAFEHDVLVAEKQEGFSKGEIITMMNTGYKQHDRVILRANVIAAR